MEILDYISEFSYPTAIIAAYVVLTLIKQYTKIKPKYYTLCAVITGVAIVVLQEIIINPITIQKIIAGALSGLIAVASYEAIHKIINKNKPV